MKYLFISLLISLLQINISPALLEWSGDSVVPKSASISATGSWQADSLLYSGVFRLNVNSGTGNSVITVSPVSVNTPLTVAAR